MEVKVYRLNGEKSPYRSLTLKKANKERTLARTPVFNIYFVFDLPQVRSLSALCCCLDVIGSAYKLWFVRHPWRTGALVTVCVAVVYFVYLCLPHGYSRLEQLESSLNQLTPQGAPIGNVRAGLSQEGINYYERVEKSAGPLLSVGSQVKISANPGERVILSRHPTDAWQFPCAEELNIILVFDNQNKLARSYIGRFHRCP
ncbi:MAG: hypothetical protein ACRD3Q_04625 [Terriglobales bacterium]